MQPSHEPTWLAGLKIYIKNLLKYFGLSGIMVLLIGVIINGFIIAECNGNLPLTFLVYLY
jgi:hypothetical protein